MKKVKSGTSSSSSSFFFCDHYVCNSSFRKQEKLIPFTRPGVERGHAFASESCESVHYI